MRTVKGTALLVTGLLACPCHLPLTLGLLAVAFGGTALGVFLEQHTGLVIAAATGYFVVAIVLGLRYLGVSSSRRANEACCDVPSREVASQQTTPAEREPVGRR